MQKAALYLRVSTADQALEGHSLPAQEAKLRAYCAFHGLEIAAVITDPGVSAAKVPLAKRPGGQELLSLIAAGEVQHVVALKLDRMFRRTVDCLLMVEEWSKTDIAVHFLDLFGQTVDTRTPLGKFFLTTIAALGELERGQTSERTKLALAHIKDQGVKLGRPVGITSESVAALERAKELRSQNLSLRSIASLLDEEGYPTARGRSWSAEAVRKLLSREAA